MKNIQIILPPPVNTVYLSGVPDDQAKGMQEAFIEPEVKVISVLNVNGKDRQFNKHQILMITVTDTEGDPS